MIKGALSSVKLFIDFIKERILLDIENCIVNNYCCTKDNRLYTRPTSLLV